MWLLEGMNERIVTKSLGRNLAHGQSVRGGRVLYVQKNFFRATWVVGSVEPWTLDHGFWLWS